MLQRTMKKALFIAVLLNHVFSLSSAFLRPFTSISDILHDMNTHKTGCGNVVFFQSQACRSCTAVRPHLVKTAETDEKRNYYLLYIDGNKDNLQYAYKHYIKTIPADLLLNNDETEEVYSCPPSKFDILRKRLI